MRSKRPPATRIPVEDVLDLDTDAEIIEIDALVAAAAEVDVDAGIFTDEELHLMSADADAAPDPFLDAPRLGLLSEREQDVALETAIWILMAHDVLVRNADGDQEFTGLHAVVSELRAESEAAASVRVDVRDVGVQRAAIYRVRHDLFLCETVEEAGGLHHFTFRSDLRQAAWLAAWIDRESRADRTEEPLTPARLADLDPHPDALAQRCEVAAFVSLAERGADGTGPLRACTAYSGTDGVWVQTGWAAEDAGAVAMQRLSPDDLVAFLAAFLAVQP